QIPCPTVRLAPRVLAALRRNRKTPGKHVAPHVMLVQLDAPRFVPMLLPELQLLVQVASSLRLDASTPRPADAMPRYLDATLRSAGSTQALTREKQAVR